MKKWYVITLPFRNTEKRLRNAIRRGIRCVLFQFVDVELYIPIVRQLKKNSEVEESFLYDRYAFISLPELCNEYNFFRAFDDPLSSVIVLREVARRDRVDMYVPVKVTEEDITHARELCEHMSSEDYVRRETFSLGEKVRVLDGAYLGVYGSVEYFDQLDYVVFIKVFFLGKDILIKVDTRDLEKVGSTNEKNKNK